MDAAGTRRRDVGSRTTLVKANNRCKQPLLDIEVCELDVLIPTLTVLAFVQTRRQFSILASLIGGTSAFAGFWIAYQRDCPIGPTDVVLLGIIYALGLTVKKLAFLFRPRSPARLYPALDLHL